MRNLFARLMSVMFIALLLAGGSGAAFAADPDNVGSTLEGCKLAVGETLPNGGGQFICADARYTTGNLGKSWNELDLVPYRLTMQAKTAAPLTQTYTIAVVVDNENAGAPGYDFLQTLTLNATLSIGSCTAPTVGPQVIANPGIGGTGKSLYRLVTITQARNTMCVYDFYARLALGSHLFPGSSLHANMALPTTGGGVDCSGIGCSDVSIPVKEISPQSIVKDMTATVGSDHTWDIRKGSTPANLSFGDVCRADAPASLPVAITVTWTKSAAIPGGPITVITHVYATNPAARTITTSVTDRIYSGTTLLGTSGVATKDVPANTANFLMLTHTFVAAAGTTDLNDVATATYTDLVTGIAVPGTTTAKASTPVQPGGAELNMSAMVADLEKITGNGLSFSVAAPSVGNFLGYPLLADPAYLAGTQTTNPVNWGTTTAVTGDGSVTFNKTIYLAGKTITTGTLSDSATLAGLDGFVATPSALSIGISSSASVQLTLSKTIPIILGTGELIEVKFRVTSTTLGTPVSIDKTLTFVSGGPLTLTTDLTGLAPDTYAVEELSSTFFYPGGPVAGVASKLSPVGGAQKTVNLSAPNGVVVACSGTAAYVNAITVAAPRARVQKITLPVIGATDPDYSWSFALTSPTTPGFGLTQTAGANAGYVDFGIDLAAGSYLVTETQKPPIWVLTSASPDTNADKVCEFTITNADILVGGVIKSCTFTNTKQGKAKVVKTVNGAAPIGTQALTFQLRSGATPTADGSVMETLIANAGNGGVLSFTSILVPGTTYQLCEIVNAGWSTNFGTFVPNSFVPPGVAPNPGVDNSFLCGNFTVGAGETKTFTIDNLPPPNTNGRALTIGYWKTHASCTTSSTNKEPALDGALLRSGGILKPSSIVSLVNSANFGLYGQTATRTVDCPHAVSLLDKRNFAGSKMASDPLFNMVAQLVAAELNLASGSYTCVPVAGAINQAETLLNTYLFTGAGYKKPLSASDAALANSLATRLDNYNNDRPSACQ